MAFRSLLVLRLVTAVTILLWLILTISEQGSRSLWLRLPIGFVAHKNSSVEADKAVKRSGKSEEILVKGGLVIRNSNVTDDFETSISVDKEGDSIGFIGRKTKLVRIVAFPYVERKTEGCSMKQLIEDGIEQSPFLTLSMDVDDFNGSTVWVVDRLSFQNLNVGKRNWCDCFAERVQAAQKKRQSLGFPLNWTIYVLNQADAPGLTPCPAVESLVGHDKVMYSQRSIIEHRDYDSSTNWTNLGTRMNLSLDNGRIVSHRPINVRTDIVRAVEEELRYGSRKISSSSPLAEPIEAFDRTIDVGYFWKPDGRPNSRFRDSVYESLSALAKEKPWRFQIGFQGVSKSKGRHNAERKYIRAMLSCKIVVVAQRDKWEDHYRLFEGMAAGSLVFTDRMLSLPEGLEDGVSVIEFDSPSDLRNKLEYYVNHDKERLAIARHGRGVAMSQHRSWHRMEEIIFGEALTVCPGGTETTCPFIVYPNETFQA